jgi:putative copper export protein
VSGAATDGGRGGVRARPQPPTTGWPGWPLLAAAATAAALLTAAAALVYGGGRPQPALPGLSEPGPLTEWALPLTRVLLDLAGVATVGLLVAAVVLVPSPGKGLSPQATWYVRRAAALAAGWVVLSLVSAVLTASDILGRPVGDLAPALLAEIAQSRALLVEAGLAAATGLAAAVLRSRDRVVLLLVVAVAAVLPPAFTGHAAEAGDHGTAISSLVFHLIGVTAWAGGLAGLLTYATRRPGEPGGPARTVSPTARRQALHAAARRFSALALGAYLVVVLSGLVNAWVRLPSLDVLDTAYGRLVLGKIVAALALGVAGYLHRDRTLAALGRGHGGAFVRLATAEVVLMALTVGLAVGLSRTPP